MQLVSVGQDGGHRWHHEENVWVLGCQLVSAEKGREEPGRRTSPRTVLWLLDKQMGHRGLLTGLLQEERSQAQEQLGQRTWSKLVLSGMAV